MDNPNENKQAILDKLSAKMEYTPSTFNSLPTTTGTQALSDTIENHLVPTEDLTMLRPRDMLVNIDFINIAVNTKVRHEEWEGKEKEILTIPTELGNGVEQKMEIAYDKGYFDTKTFEEGSKLYAYADEIGFNPLTGRVDVIFNKYLEWRGYQKRKDGSFNFDTKKKIWKTIYNASTTRIRRKFGFVVKSGKTSKTLYEQRDLTQIKELVGYYLREGREVEIREYQETPPDRFAFEMDDFFKTQMTGKVLDGGVRLPRQVTITPKIPASEKNKKYQGKTEDFLNWLCDRFGRSHKGGIRNYQVIEAVKRGGGGYKEWNKRIKETERKLAFFTKEKHIKDWGYRQTTHTKQLDKTNNKALFLWIDFSGTPTYERIQNDFRKHKTIGDRLDDIEKTQRETQKEVKDIKNNW